MRRSIPALIAGLALLVPAAAAAKTVKLTGTAKVRAISGNVVAGSTTSSLGKGAAVYTTAAGPKNTIVSKFTLFEATGTLKGTASVTSTQSAAGQPGTLTGTARITGGTGAYRGAKGGFKISGVVASDGLLTLTVKSGSFTVKG